MIRGEEVAQAFDGVRRLARFDPGGIALFGQDAAACARSFWAYGLALPAIFLLLAVDVADAAPGERGWIAIADVIGEVVEIAGFPLLLLPILARFGRAERWAWLITAYNWYTGVTAVLLVGILGLAIGPLSDLGLWPYWAAEVYVLVVEAFLAQSILQVGGVQAIAFVLLDVGFTLGVRQIGHFLALGGWG